MVIQVLQLDHQEKDLGSWQGINPIIFGRDIKALQGKLDFCDQPADRDTADQTGGKVMEQIKVERTAFSIAVAIGYFLA